MPLDAEVFREEIHVEDKELIAILARSNLYICFFQLCKNLTTTQTKVPCHVIPAKAL